MLRKPEFVFGHFLQERRKAMNLTYKQVAEKIGYKNISKGIRKIEALEDGFFHPVMATKVMECLGVTDQEWQQCLDEEERYLHEAIAKLPPFKPVLILRAFAACYLNIHLPADLTDHESMIAYAADYAKQRGCKCCLVLDYDLKYWITEKGEVPPPDRSIAEPPCMRIK